MPSGLVAACVYPGERGHGGVYQHPRGCKAPPQTTLELILSTHRIDCLSCTPQRRLRAAAAVPGIRRGYEPLYQDSDHEATDIDDSMPHLVRDNSKCILCRRCVAVCQKNQDAGVIETCERGYDTHIGCAFDMPLSETACVACGQCTAVCPTGCPAGAGRHRQGVGCAERPDQAR